MGFITIQEYKSIVNNSKANDTQVGFFIIATEKLIKDRLGDITFGERIIKVEDKNVFLDNGIAKIYTNCLNISEIVEVNGEAYTGNVEYGGKFNDILYIDVDSIMSVNSYVKLKVVAGFQEIPDDIKLLQAYLIKDAITQLDGGNIISKKIGDKSLSFSEHTGDSVKGLITSIFKSYIIHY